ncbi:hypothetical protein TrVE_jg11277 [Triparma verrucosa]|uniref:Alpha-galactosidase n=1 Tax=Triparma verrucosa TaxID=1606542 RepID=A0A9W7FJU2_9STRA|nr:hypothetical protein TrVE_jg11277 [Triparma verrucosa]
MEFLTKFSPKAKSKKLPKSKQEPQGSPAQFVGLPHTIKSVDGSQNFELREDGWSIFGDGGGWPLIGVELLEVELSNNHTETFASTDILTLKTETINDPALGPQSATVITFPPLTDSCSSNTILTIVWDNSEKYKNLLYYKCTIPKCEVKIESYTIPLGINADVPPTNVHISSYQSWGYTGTVRIGSKQPVYALPAVFAGAFHDGGKKTGMPYESDYFTCLTSNDSGVDSSGDEALTVGYLTQKEGLCVVGVNSKGTKVRAKSTIEKFQVDGEWLCVSNVGAEGYDLEPMAKYLDKVGEVNKGIKVQPAVGWCSWYEYYENITHDVIVNNCDGLKKSSLNPKTIVVDDGYMKAWGDWNDLKEGFEDMGKTAEGIKSKGFVPGLWIAPFAVDKFSKIYEEHPDWILRMDNGKPCNSGNCAKWFYGLDPTNPEVIEYVKIVVKRAVEDWGYECLKLDFLYASCLDGVRFNQQMSRAEAYNLAVTTLREAAGPKTFLIGCGAPILPSVGIFDSVRVSADTGPTWAPTLPMPWWDQANLPCVRSMIRNSVSRCSISDRFWCNDPDCLLLREDTKLTYDEVKSTVAVVGMTGGMLLLSDDMSKITKDREKLVEQIVPSAGVPGIPLDLHARIMPRLIRLVCSDKAGEAPRGTIKVAPGLGTWSIVSLSNWGDYKTRRIGVDSHSLELGDDEGKGYHTFNVWTNIYKYQPAGTDGTRFERTLSSHETQIVVVKPVIPGIPTYIGSTFHFTSGFEISKFESETNAAHGSLRVAFKPGHFRSTDIAFFFLPCIWVEGGYSDDVIVHINNRVTKSENFKMAATLDDGTVLAVKCGVERPDMEISIVW